MWTTIFRFDSGQTPHRGEMEFPYDCHKETYEGPGAAEAWDDLIEIIDQMCSANGVIE